MQRATSRGKVSKPGKKDGMGGRANKNGARLGAVLKNHRTVGGKDGQKKVGLSHL